MPRVLSAATARPDYVLRQSEAREFCRALFGGAHDDIERLLPVFESARIDERRISIPPEWLYDEHSFAEKNARYVEVALDLAESAARSALARAGVGPGEVSHILFASTTGLATPSLDARLMNRIAFSPHARRTPIWGLGCAGGAAGLARAAELSNASGGAPALLIALELCSLTFQKDDLTKSNLVATSLFGDGAAAIVVGADAGGDGGTSDRRAPGPEIVASRSTLFPDSLDVMGWDVNDAGLKVIFSRDIPSIVRESVRPNAEAFLAERGLALADVRHFIAHPGGTKVMAAYEEAFELPDDALRHAREVLRICGNMSSPTVLFVLERYLDDPSVREGDLGLLTALGPGFSSELVLLQW